MGSKAGISQAGATQRAPGPLALLKMGWNAAKAVPGRLLLVIIAGQLLISLIAGPLIAWLFREALRANGMVALDTDTFVIGRGFPVTVLLLFLLALVAMWAIVLQLSMFLILMRYPQASWKQLGARLWSVTRKLVQRQSWLLTLYVLVVIPLSGFGFMSGLLRNIAVPNFITGELEKDPLNSALLLIAYVLLFYLNLRLSLALPVFALSDQTGRRSLGSSWHMTGGFRAVPIVLATALIVVGLGAGSVALFYLMLGPTALTDAVWPGASWVVAAISMGVAHVAVMLLVGFAVAMMAAMLTAFAETRGGLVLEPVAEPVAGGKRRSGAWAGGVIAVACLGYAVAYMPVLQAVAQHPETIVIGHRGWTAGGVENTIGALEAANAAGAEFVEMDAMQTKDGSFIVMHDTDLKRLAGQNVRVEDLTLEELTAITVHDELGHEDKIPSLVDYVTRANELGQPLLIEIKLGGADTDDHVELLLAELEDNDLLDGHIFHTLDHASADRLKELRPDLTVGYILPFAAVGVPETQADFLVLEESAATRSMARRVDDAGLGYFVWTVNDRSAIAERMREAVDAIITDHPDVGLTLREEMGQQTGMAGRLHDTMRAFLGI